MDPHNYLREIFSETFLPIVYVDFDGTISKLDVIDRVLETFADPRWVEVEEKWLAGEIGSRACCRAEFALVRVSPGELDEFLETLKLDEGLYDLLDVCRNSGMELHIVSDGFEYYISRMLKRAGILDRYGDIKIWANRLIPFESDKWRTDFPYYDSPCRDGCATCKPAVMVRENPRAAPTMFVGDGLSDRFAARQADVVFAKSQLSAYCLEHRTPQTSFKSLREVAAQLDEAFESFVKALFKERRWKRVA